jgi:hypothetical protein
MGRDRFAWGRVVASAGLVGAVAVAAGCSSGTARPPFPADPDPCAAYCLKWVPPVYRDVPRVCMTKPPCERSYDVCTVRTRYRTVCVPGECKNVTVPDETQVHQVVQVTPAREEWRQVECRDCFGCDVDDCWRRVRVPPTYDVCVRCETKEGFSYCVEPPPTFVQVAETCPTTECRTEYVPAEYGIRYERECYQPGHWVWEKRDCAEPVPDCPPVAVCAPCPHGKARCDACPPPSAPRRVAPPRATWGRCPPAD